MKKYIKNLLFFLFFIITINNGIKSSEEQNQQKEKMVQALKNLMKNPESIKFFEKLSKQGSHSTDANFIEEFHKNLSQKENQELQRIAFEEMKKTLYPNDSSFSFEKFQEYIKILDKKTNSQNYN
ncbi:MAG: hypothetical protein WCD44_02005 [Candidatus Babeliales bacterium]